MELESGESSEDTRDNAMKTLRVLRTNPGRGRRFRGRAVASPASRGRSCAWYTGAAASVDGSAGEGRRAGVHVTGRLAPRRLLDERWCTEVTSCTWSIVTSARRDGRAAMLSSRCPADSTLEECLEALTLRSSDIPQPCGLMTSRVLDPLATYSITR